jgi:hypothetical protein
MKRAVKEKRCSMAFRSSCLLGNGYTVHRLQPRRCQTFLAMWKDDLTNAASAWFRTFALLNLAD